VLADASLLTQVFTNLISNAVKFTQRTEHALVEIGSRREDGSTVFFVRDNGAGFDMQYAGQLFTLFRRLHRQDEFSGTGVGLSLSQRVVQRHGGRIWAEGAVNEGATFFFSLPD
jgi:light-regulated signal transduction histidine kinase (bacteriophytochrome)